MIYLRLFLEFFRTGLFAVGGGLATIPFLYHISDSTGWFTHGQLADMIAVSESTPGPMGVNMATYVGYTVGGVPGAVIATLGLITPSILVILIVARFLAKFRTNRTVDAVFYGLRPASCGLIAAAGLSVVRSERAFGGDISVEIYCPGGGDPGADPVGQAHQKAAPHCVYRPFGGGGNPVRRPGDLRGQP